MRRQPEARSTVLLRGLHGLITPPTRQPIAHKACHGCPPQQRRSGCPGKREPRPKRGQMAAISGTRAEHGGMRERARRWRGDGTGHAGWGKSIPHLWTSSETRSGEVKCHLGCAATANRAGMGNAAVRAGRARGMREAGGHLGSLRGVECRLHHTCCGPAAEDGNRQGVVSA